jgi:hypothetical protein
MEEIIGEKWGIVKRTLTEPQSSDCEKNKSRNETKCNDGKKAAPAGRNVYNRRF